MFCPTSSAIARPTPTRRRAGRSSASISRRRGERAQALCRRAVRAGAGARRNLPLARSGRLWFRSAGRQRRRRGQRSGAPDHRRRDRQADRSARDQRAGAARRGDARRDRARAEHDGAGDGDHVAPEERQRAGGRRDRGSARQEAPGVRNAATRGATNSRASWRRDRAASGAWRRARRNPHDRLAVADHLRLRRRAGRQRDDRPRRARARRSSAMACR